MSQQSWATLRRPPVNQVAHGMPSVVSRTSEYGVEKVRPRNSTTAAQNHSGSSIDRRTRSGNEAMR